MRCTEEWNEQQGIYIMYAGINITDGENHESVWLCNEKTVSNREKSMEMWEVWCVWWWCDCVSVWFIGSTPPSPSLGAEVSFLCHRCTPECEPTLRSPHLEEWCQHDVIWHHTNDVIWHHTNDENIVTRACMKAFLMYCLLTGFRLCGMYGGHHCTIYSRRVCVSEWMNHPWTWQLNREH